MSHLPGERKGMVGGLTYGVFFEGNVHNSLKKKFSLKCVLLLKDIYNTVVVEGVDKSVLGCKISELALFYLLYFTIMGCG